MDFTDVISNKNIFLVVGATTNKEKYGFKVFRNLIYSNNKAYPINPKYESILGVDSYRTIDDFPYEFDVVIFVIPPDNVLEVLKKTKRKIKAIWLQPGSENEEIIKYCEENNIFCVHDMCIMVQKND